MRPPIASGTAMKYKYFLPNIPGRRAGTCLALLPRALGLDMRVREPKIGVAPLGEISNA